MPRAENLSEKEIGDIISEVEGAVCAGKIKRVSDEEVMRTRLAALENSIAQFNKDLDALYESKNIRRKEIAYEH